MASSTIPAVKQAILDILTARAGLSSATISWAGPTKDEDFTGEMIWLGPVENDDDWAELGAKRRRENYRVGITAWVEQWGDDPQTAEERLWELWAEVTEGIRDDLRTGGLLTAAGADFYGRITYRQETGPATPEKWGSSLIGQVGFTARTV